jgi:hypothetical protein
MPRGARKREAPLAAPVLGNLAEWAETLAANVVSHKLSTLENLRALYRDDFGAFCPIVKINDRVTGEPIPFVPSWGQRTFNEHRTGRDLWNKSRQVYATTNELVRDVWYLLTHRGASIQIVCQTKKDREILLDLERRIDVILQSLIDEGLQIRYAGRAQGRWELAVEDGGAVMTITEAGATKETASNVGRGGTKQRIHFTEVAYYHIAAATMRAALPTVHGAAGDGTEITMESSPNGISVRDGSGKESGDDFNAAGGPYFHIQYQRAKEGKTDFTAHFTPWYKHPDYCTALDPNEVVQPDQQPIHDRRLREEQLVALGVSPEQLKWYRRQVASKGQNSVDQEYPSDDRSCFLISGRVFFDRDVTLALLAVAQRNMLGREVRTILRAGAQGELRLYKQPEPGHRYHITVDTSSGEGGDPGSLVVHDRSAPRAPHVATLHGQFRPLELARLAVAIGARFNWAQVCVERNNHGSAVLQELERPGVMWDVFGDGLAEYRAIAALSDRALASLLPWAKAKPCYPCVWRDTDQRSGWWTGATSRSDALSLLEQDHREGAWETPDVAVLDEMLTFVVRARIAADAGSHDDLVMAMVIAHAVMSRPPEPGMYRSLGNLPPA